MADTESCPLHVPDLEDILVVLDGGLKKNYAEVQVKVVDCPDLTQEPYGFPVKGLSGKPRIADVGGVPYLVPTARLDKVYNINTVAKKIDLPGAYILGAGASSFKSVGMNAEMIFSVLAESLTSPSVNSNYIASVNPVDNGCLLQKYREKHKDDDFGLLSNLYASEGKPGKGFDLRVEHTHCFSHHGEGGHYHNDTTPDIVQYLGYFHPAEYLYRIDRPNVTHMIGRD